MGLLEGKVLGVLILQPLDLLGVVVLRALHECTMHLEMSRLKVVSWNHVQV